MGGDGKRMKEYIAVEKQTDSGGYIEIVSELVRCKDCSYYGAIENGKCPLWCAFIYPEGYCFQAERKKE